jgi:hypothetical protein
MAPPKKANNMPVAAINHPNITWWDGNMVWQYNVILYWFCIIIMGKSFGFGCYYGYYCFYSDG